MTTSETPRVFAELEGQTATFRVPGAGPGDELTADGADDARAMVLRRALWEARHLATPIELVITGDQGEHRIVVSPDGTIAPSQTGHALHPPDVTGTTAEPTITSRLTLAESATGPRPASTRPDAAIGSPRPSFVTAEPAIAPAGLAAVLARLGIPPTRTQAQYQAGVRATSRHWGGCRVVAVVNGKGGVGKTMTAAMLAAVFARNGGGGVLAWDNNDTRGTLGWRTEAGHHDATIQDALAGAPQLLAPSAGAGDIAWYVHHQTADRYDVLRSNPQLLAASQRIGASEFDQLLQVAARYYRLVVFDSGNDESAPRWLRMIDAAHQLVVPTLAAPESAESAALLLEALADRDEHSARLAADAVVIISQAEPGSPGEVRRIAEVFAPLVRAVQVIPFDPALKSGPLRFETTRPSTRRAWVAAAAEIAQGLQ